MKCWNTGRYLVSLNIYIVSFFRNIDLYRFYSSIFYLFFLLNRSIHVPAGDTLIIIQIFFIIYVKENKKLKQKKLHVCAHKLELVNLSLLLS